MNELIFLANELQNPEKIKILRLPLKFISFGIIPGKLYKLPLKASNLGKSGKFVTTTNALGKRALYNSVVYGTLFVCQDFFFHKRALDAYHACSLSTLQQNHSLDYQHRKEVNTILIKFNSLSDLRKLKYEEKEQVTTQTYFGNLNHPDIKQRIKADNPSHRIRDGIDAEAFKKLYSVIGGEL